MTLDGSARLTKDDYRPAEDLVVLRNDLREICQLHAPLFARLIWRLSNSLAVHTGGRYRLVILDAHDRQLVPADLLEDPQFPTATVEPC